MTQSAALFRASNLLILDYPFEAALASALRICDEAVVIIGQSEDATPAYVRDLAAPYGERVILHETRSVFDRMWQQRWWELAASLTNAEWLMYHDADEAIHARDTRTLHELMARPEVRLIRFPFVHFYATPSYYKARGFLTHNTRLGRRSAGYAMVNWCTDATPKHAACAMVVNEGGKQVDAHHPALLGSVTVDAPVLHYGWCRSAHSLAISQAKHHAWYANGAGLEDGRVPDVQPYDFRLAEKIATGEVRAYAGVHPHDLHPWFAAHSKAWDAAGAELVRVTA